MSIILSNTDLPSTSMKAHPRMGAFPTPRLDVTVNSIAAQSLSEPGTSSASSAAGPLYDDEIVFAAKLLLEFSDNLRKHFESSRASRSGGTISKGKGKRARKSTSTSGNASKRRRVVNANDESTAVNVDDSAEAGPSSVSAASTSRTAPRRRSPASSTSSEQSSIVARVKQNSRQKTRRSQE